MEPSTKIPEVRPGETEPCRPRIKIGKTPRNTKISQYRDPSPTPTIETAGPTSSPNRTPCDKIFSDPRTIKTSARQRQVLLPGFEADPVARHTLLHGHDKHFAPERQVLPRGRRVPHPGRRDPERQVLLPGSIDARAARSTS